MMLSAKLLSLSVLLTLTLVSNACSAAAIARSRRKISRMYYFLLQLSVADALTALLTLAPELVMAWEEAAPTSEVACRGTKYLQMLAPYLR